MIAVFRADSRRLGAMSRLAGAAALRSLLCVFLAMAVSVGAGRALASEDGKQMLMVRADDAGEGVLFTRDRLVGLGLHRIETETPWTDGVTVFEGPLLRDVLAEARVSGERIEAVALNDYRVEIPVSDAKGFDVILAMQVNGKAIGVRERGPLWVIYPWDRNEDLRSELYYSRAIWQLRELIVRP